MKTKIKIMIGVLTLTLLLGVALMAREGGLQGRLVITTSQLSGRAPAKALPSGSLNRVPTPAAPAAPEFIPAVDDQQPIIPGTIAVDLSPMTPRPSQVAPGTQRVPFTTFQFVATNEPIRVKTLTLTDGGGYLPPDYIRSMASVILANVSLYDGNTVVAGPLAFNGYYLRFHSDAGLFTVNPGETKLITVKADIANENTLRLIPHYTILGTALGLHIDQLTPGSYEFEAVGTLSNRQINEGSNTAITAPSDMLARYGMSFNARAYVAPVQQPAQQMGIPPMGIGDIQMRLAESRRNMYGNTLLIAGY